MRTNKVKANIKAGKKSYGMNFSFPSLQLLEMVGSLGFDYIWLDGEHGTFTLNDVEEMCMLAERLDLVVLARVPNTQPSTIGQYLDRGVMGITGPHMVTKADAEALVRACKFAPQGRRSWPISRFTGYVLPAEASQQMAQFNEEVLVSALIEDAEALGNVAEITSVPGVDAVSIGPFDLSQSLCVQGQPRHPKVTQAIERAAAEVRACGKAWWGDLMSSTFVSILVVDAAREYLRKAKGG
ncbi:MAG: aldolase/citrate lyase family protein [Chloroflexota bacterium]|nr:aldolase/citrate lyase family protein [Chloroflexota bacterium]